MPDTSSKLPSIFNDVLGPVMRGPSSSHCAAALRIGRIARDLMNQKINSVLVEYTPDGSLVTTHESQGSDMGLYSGFLGYDAQDAKIARYRDEVREAGLEIDVQIVDYRARHPNTYKLTLQNDTESHKMTAISTGGGMIEVLQIDEADVELDGGYWATLIYSDDDLTELAKTVTEVTSADAVTCHFGPHPFVMIRAQRFVDDASIDSLAANVTTVKRLAPVLPVLSGSHIDVPFTTCDEMMAYNATRNLPLWKLALQYESARGRIPESIDIINCR
jgi:L-serine dehydratase